ncbi:hypothetical protein LZK73_10265 [Neorhizobium galegae]|nr:hypothetical protein LZK73_10265 [Neorhizobium galegae]
MQFLVLSGRQRRRQAAAEILFQSPLEVVEIRIVRRTGGFGGGLPASRRDIDFRLACRRRGRLAGGGQKRRDPASMSSS